MTAVLYDNDSVSDQDLRIATVLGTQSRYQTGLSAAKCTTTVLTNETVAYAWIDDGYDNNSDSLVIVGGTETEDGSETVYSDIPFVDNMTARWDPRTGVMTFRRNDNGTVENEQWELAMNSIGFKPASANYQTTKKLKFSIGRLSFEIDGIDHFYNFNDTTPADWDAAQASASASRAVTSSSLRLEPPWIETDCLRPVVRSVALT